jgi:Tfp pilus assembly protein PilF
MSPGHVWRTLAGPIALAALVGCATSRSLLPKQGSGPKPTVEAAAPRTSNLPPKRAAQVCIRTAEEMEKRGYDADAARQYEKAREYDASVQVEHRLAVLYDRQGDFARANLEYKRALEAHPKDANLLNDMGYYCYERGDWPGAEEWLRKALKYDPKLQRAWVNLGMALAQQGRSDESIAAFTKAISPAQAKANLGMILAQKGQYDQARQALQESLGLEPDAKLTQAVLAEMSKRWPDAKSQPPVSSRISAN